MNRAIGQPLYHIIAILPSGEERIYTRFGIGRAHVFAATLPRGWAVEVQEVSPEDRSPVCDPGRQS